MSVNLLLVAEWLLGLPVMGLAPILTITNGMPVPHQGGDPVRASSTSAPALLFLTLIPADPPTRSIAIPAFCR